MSIKVEIIMRLLLSVVILVGAASFVIVWILSMIADHVEGDRHLPPSFPDDEHQVANANDVQGPPAARSYPIEARPGRAAGSL